MLKTRVNAIARLIQSCTSLEEGRCIHAGIKRSDLAKDSYLCNLLIAMYGRYRSAAEARTVFDSLEASTSVFSWNLLVNAYVSSDKCQDAVAAFFRMPRHDVVSWNSLLLAYTRLERSPAAKQAFDAMPERSVVSWTTMITAYTVSRQLLNAKGFFTRMPEHNKVTFSAMLQALTQHAGSNEAKFLFDATKERESSSWNTLLNAYALEENIELAKEILAKMPSHCKFSWTIMVLAYARSNLLDKAKQLFDTMPERDVVSWNALLQASAENGLLDSAAKLFERVPHCSMSSCNIMLGAYVQCGYLDRAHELFARVPDGDLESWSIIILGCAGNRQERLALQRFGEMLLEGIKCDEITMLGVLSACNHLGLIEEGVSYFVMMVAELGIAPFVEHFSSLVDLLARVGQLREALDLLKNMPFVPDPAACCSMLGACRIHGEVDLGAFTAQEEFGIDQHPSPYLLLSNIHSG